MKILQLYLLIFVISMPVISQDQTAEPCLDSKSFFPYKAAIQAEKQGDLKEAFDIYCNLAFKGDYRAQFKLAQLYQLGIDNYVDEDLSFAYVWAKISNRSVKSTKRLNFILEIESIADQDTLELSEKLFAAAVKEIQTGRRIDMEYKPIDYEKIRKDLRRKRKLTGSRIERKKRPVNLKIINF